MAHRGIGGRYKAPMCLPHTANELLGALTTLGPKSPSALSARFHLSRTAVVAAMRQLLRAHLVRAAKRRHTRYRLGWEIQYRATAINAI